MKYIIKFNLGLFGIIFLMAFCSTNAWAEVKAIPGVSIKVNSKLNSGDFLDKNNINIGSDSGSGVNICLGSDNLCRIIDAEFVDSGSKPIHIGDEIKMKITLEPQDTDSHDYAFKGSYSSANISVNGGRYVSSRKQNGDLIVTLKLKPLRGQYDTPSEVTWRDDVSIGKASWYEPDNSSGYYDLILYRKNTHLYRVNAYKGSSYNFYPYMDKEGTYSFKIRTVAKSNVAEDVGNSSDWVQSDEYYVDKHNVSDGSGKHNTNANFGPGTTNNNNNSIGKAGWIQDRGQWYYRYPNGDYKKDGWEYISNNWYLFDNSGKMLTGWQERNGHTYFLNPNGEMKTGWIFDANEWYYLNSESGSDTEGAVVKSKWLRTEDGKSYFMLATGAMAQGWTAIGDKWYYFYPAHGHLAVNTTVDTFRVGEDGAWIR